MKTPNKKPTVRNLLGEYHQLKPVREAVIHQKNKSARLIHPKLMIC